MINRDLLSDSEIYGDEDVSYEIYRELEDKHQELKEKYSDLEDEYYFLMQEHEKLKIMYEKIVEREISK